VKIAQSFSPEKLVIVSKKNRRNIRLFVQREKNY